MNGDATHSQPLDESASEMAFALVDRTLTAIGGLEIDDPIKAIDAVLAMYERALERIRRI